MSPGRRLRCFARLIMLNKDGLPCLSYAEPPLDIDPQATYAEAMRQAEATHHDLLNALPIVRTSQRVEFHEIIPGHTTRQSLWEPLQDLGDEIQEDIHDACAAFDDPDIYYPGPDNIAPMDDGHVRLVIWAMQPTLKANTRDKLPAAPLDELPWRIQRALAERRRLRFQQWGIGQEQWKANTWSLWDVPEDWDYVPRRASYGRGRGH